MTDTSVDAISKSIFQSKTFWTNLLGPAILWASTKYGLNLDAETQAAVITVVMMVANIVLRKITTQPVHVIAPSQS